MKSFTLGLCALALSASAALAAAASNENVGPKPKQDPMAGYYGNTYSCYWPGVFECRHWWNADGSEIYFEARWLPEGLITTKTVDGPYTVFWANGQWCARNARGGAPGRPAAAGLAAAADDDDAPRGGGARDPLNNNKNGCQPIVDAVPGDHWFKLHLNGQYTDERESYVLMPGHQ